MTTLKDIKAKIRSFIVHNFVREANLNSFRDDDSFLGRSIVDSTGMLELVSFLEQNFNIKVRDDELIPDNLDSVDKAASFVMKKKS